MARLRRVDAVAVIGDGTRDPRLASGEVEVGPLKPETLACVVKGRFLRATHLARRRVAAAGCLASNWREALYKGDIDLRKKLAERENFDNDHHLHGVFAGRTPYEGLRERLEECRRLSREVRHSTTSTSESSVTRLSALPIAHRRRRAPVLLHYVNQNPESVP